MTWARSARRRRRARSAAARQALRAAPRCPAAPGWRPCRPLRAAPARAGRRRAGGSALCLATESATPQFTENGGVAGGRRRPARPRPAARRCAQHVHQRSSYRSSASRRRHRRRARPLVQGDGRRRRRVERLRRDLDVGHGRAALQVVRAARRARRRRRRSRGLFGALHSGVAACRATSATRGTGHSSSSADHRHGEDGSHRRTDPGLAAVGIRAPRAQHDRAGAASAAQDRPDVAQVSDAVEVEHERTERRLGRALLVDREHPRPEPKVRRFRRAGPARRRCRPRDGGRAASPRHPRRRARSSLGHEADALPPLEAPSLLEERVLGEVITGLGHLRTRRAPVLLKEERRPEKLLVAPGSYAGTGSLSAMASRETSRIGRTTRRRARRCRRAPCGRARPRPA